MQGNRTGTFCLTLYLGMRFVSGDNDGEDYNYDDADDGYDNHDTDIDDNQSDDDDDDATAADHDDDDGQKSGQHRPP